MKNCQSWDTDDGAAVPEAGAAIGAALPASPAWGLLTKKRLEKFQNSLVLHAAT